MLYEEELTPLYTAADLYLKPSYKIAIIVTLPKLRQMGQSVSNWEIRERLKKMLSSVEVSDFRVLDSTLEEVQFEVAINSFTDSNKVVSLLDGVTFRAVGFIEPLGIRAERAKPDFPTRVDWDRHFATSSSSKMSEREPGERPDTVYVGGLPFEWFKTRKDTLERVIRLMFTEFGEVRHVDIPQCDPLRKQMEPEISGIQLSSWSYSQEPFFEAYVQFKEYAGFVNAMSTLGGKVLVQRQPGGLGREAKLKVDFDRSAHLSHRKISQRSIRRALIESQSALERERAEIEEANLRTEPEEDEAGKLKREQLTRQLIRAEKRQKIDFQRNYERVLRTKLEKKLSRRVHQEQEYIIRDRERGAIALMRYISVLYSAQVEALKYCTVSVSELANEYAREANLPEEEALRERLLRKRELEMRSKLAKRLLH